MEEVFCGLFERQGSVEPDAAVTVVAYGGRGLHEPGSEWYEVKSKA